MSNQAQSLASDLLVGAGEVWFNRKSASKDSNGFHHLGNVDEFSITVDVTTVEKNSSMNKKRTLMATVTTAVKPSASLTLTEYNPYDLALGLYGEEAITKQEAVTLTDEPYILASVPGIITLTDKDGNRYYDVKDIVVKPSDAGSTTATVKTAPSSMSFTGSTLTDEKGGKIQIDTSAYATGTDERLFFSIDTANTADGEIAGLVINFKEGITGAVQKYTATTGTTETFTLASGAKAIITLTSSDSFTAFSSGVMAEVEIVAPKTAYVKGVDYDCSEQDARAGIIRFLPNGSLKTGDTVLVSASVPERTFSNVSLGDAGDIEGELLFVGDANVGINYTIEGWKVKVQPDGDLSGLISSDFGSYKLKVDFLDDSEHHPQFPYAKVTAIERVSDAQSGKGEYLPEW